MLNLHSSYDARSMRCRSQLNRRSGGSVYMYSIGVLHQETQGKDTLGTYQEHNVDIQLHVLSDEQGIC